MVYLVIHGEKMEAKIENENVKAYWELQEMIRKMDAADKERKRQRKHAIRLAKRILKRKADIEMMRKELSEIFWFDGDNRAFKYSDRTRGGKIVDLVREALER